MLLPDLESAATILDKKGIKLPLPLRDYQWQGIHFLISSSNALLADEMGLGKTVQVAVAVNLLITLKAIRSILVVCPVSLCLNWARELYRWAPNIFVRRIIGDFDDRKAHYRLPFQLWIASYEQIRSDIEFISNALRFDLVILDEAQRIKNPDASLSLASRQIPRERSWALTGTPLENRVEDLFAIYNFVKPGLLHAALSFAEIQTRMEPYFLRRKKSDVLSELPAIIYQDIVLELVGPQRESYDDAWVSSRTEIREQRGRISEASLFAKITKLKQICNFDPITGQSQKVDALQSILEEATLSCGKVLIFSQYVDTLRELQNRLGGKEIRLLIGDLTQDERANVVTWFEESPGPAVLLCSLRVAGVGINLNSASLVVLFDRWWNPAVEDQAIQRAHRFGRATALQVIKFIVADTIEERIESLLKRKTALFNDYVETMKPEESIWSHADLIKILGLGAGYKEEETS